MVRGLSNNSHTQRVHACIQILNRTKTYTESKHTSYSKMILALFVHHVSA